MNLIANITSDQAIRNAISSEVGEDLLGLMDALRVNNSTALFPRVPDNDGDSRSNAEELANGGDPNFREISFGDVNLDGNINFLDIGPFVNLLSNGTYQCEADIDENGVVDFLDINPFVDLLSQ